MQAYVNIIHVYYASYIIARLLHSDSGVVAPSVQPESLPSQSVTAESYIGINYIVEATNPVCLSFINYTLEIGT